MAELEGNGSQLEILSEGDGAAPVLRISGQLDISNASTLERALTRALSDGASSVVFDLTGLEFMDSAGISVLVRARSEVEQVRVRNPTPIVRRLIEITGLSEILPIDAPPTA